jgi:hypothetical protein
LHSVSGLALAPVAAASLLCGAVLPGAARAAESAMGEIPAAAETTSAVEVQRPASRWQLGGTLILGIPTGEFKDHVETGGGLTGQGRYRLDSGGWASLEMDGGVLIYGSQRRWVPLQTYAGLVSAELTTTNSIAMLGVGPRLGLPSGTLRPYVRGSVGFSYFWTQSSVSGYGGSTYFSSKNLSDTVFGWGVGAGVAICLHDGPKPILLEISVAHRSHGKVQYLPPDGITDNGDGTATYNIVESKADLALIGVGITFGLR